MQPSFLVAALAFVLLLAGCRTNGDPPHDPHDPHAAPADTAAEARADTTAALPPVDTAAADEDDAPPRNTPGAVTPAPGTAAFRLRVQSCDAPARGARRCRVRVDEVIAYGAAFGALPAGTELEVRLPDAVAPSDTARLAPGAELTAVLRSVRGIGIQYYEAVALR